MKRLVPLSRPRRARATLRKRILVPVDFSNCSRAALQYAVSLAGPLKASLILLYVAETSPAGSELGPCHLPDLEADLRRMAAQKLRQLTKQEVSHGIMSQSMIRAGRAEAKILEIAAGLNVDLVVMASHSKDSCQGQLGTTAGRVASLATCPVLLVPVKEVSVPFFL